MFSIIAAGLFGLLGTTLGGYISYKQQKSAAQDERANRKVEQARQWQQDRAAESERRAAEQQEKGREMRRQAAVAFVKQVDDLAESGRTYWVSLREKAHGPELESARSAYLASWQTLASDFASFQLAVTAELNREGIALYGAARDYSVAIDEIADGRRTNAKADRAQDDLLEARRQFIRAAQHDLNPSSATDPADASATT
ncbi:hypothetical protein [Geodermatophilus poikilotrophus]|uniref:Uncharacterized protein n=1 Tax=Geodermatophilus poikilotrophus TaxID=1333667 RepID=A0A1I0CRE1_9ACTN|nr:hypothetical protein [Geodermatophilus poikilotrophus]SET22344.1 hypothetical protein SAMN04488546_1732 [Geodermatophilus poikilotrophus]